jgi:P4 family phage/plasmid primase-like protien
MGGEAMSDEPSDNVTPLHPPEKSDATIDDCIAAIAALAAALATATPNDPGLKGRLEHPATIEDAARVVEATRSAGCPIARKLKAIDAEAAFRKAFGEFLPAKTAYRLQQRIEARVKGLWREERKSKREARQERHDATLADAFIEANEIFRNRHGEIFLRHDDEWMSADLGLGQAVDRFLKQQAADDTAEARDELLTNKKRAAVEQSVRKNSTLKTREVKFNSKRRIWGLPGGKVRTEDGASRPQRADDYVTMKTAIFPEPGPKPTYDRFLRETFGGDHELIKAVKRILGYAITGEVSLRKAFIFDGHGKNGKSTLARLMRAIMGDYGYQSSSKIVASGYSGHSHVFASLRDRRVVVIDEVDSTVVFGENFKTLTGNDMISGHYMYKNEEQFPVHCKLFICINAGAKFDGASKAFADRLCVIPFKNTLPEDVQNSDFGRDLDAKLLAEGPAVLAEWLDEAKAFYADPRLLPSKAIEEATRAFIGEADRYASWLEETYVKLDPEDMSERDRERWATLETRQTLPSGWEELGVPLKVVFATWEAYGKAAGERYIGTDKLLSRALKERGYLVLKHRETRACFVCGIQIRGFAKDGFAEGVLNSNDTSWG